VTHEERLRAAAENGADRYARPIAITESLAAACLAGAEALRLLKDYDIGMDMPDWRGVEEWEYDVAALVKGNA
jgi:hypothetical protein